MDRTTARNPSRRIDRRSGGLNPADDAGASRRSRRRFSAVAGAAVPAQHGDRPSQTRTARQRRLPQHPTANGRRISGRTNAPDERRIGAPSRHSGFVHLRMAIQGRLTKRGSWQLGGRMATQMGAIKTVCNVRCDGQPIGHKFDKIPPTRVSFQTTPPHRRSTPPPPKSNPCGTPSGSTPSPVRSARFDPLVSLRRRERSRYFSLTNHFAKRPGGLLRDTQPRYPNEEPFFVDVMPFLAGSPPFIGDRKPLLTEATSLPREFPPFPFDLTLFLSD